MYTFLKAITERSKNEDLVKKIGTWLERGDKLNDQINEDMANGKAIATLGMEFSFRTSTENSSPIVFRETEGRLPILEFDLTDLRISDGPLHFK